MTAIQTARRLRHPVELHASIKRSCGVTSSEIVSDFSLDGCCVSGFFRVGEQVEISIRSIGLFRAEVCWTRLGKAGARFVDRNRDRPSPAPLGTCERGVAMIEYALLAAGIAVALVIALGGLGGSVSGRWGDVNDAVAGPSVNTGDVGGNGAD